MDPCQASPRLLELIHAMMTEYETVIKHMLAESRARTVCTLADFLPAATDLIKVLDALPPLTPTNLDPETSLTRPEGVEQMPPTLPAHTNKRKNVPRADLPVRRNPVRKARKICFS